MFGFGFYAFVRNVRLETSCHDRHGDWVPVGVGLPLCGTDWVLSEELEALTACIIAHQLSGILQSIVRTNVIFTILSHRLPCNSPYLLHIHTLCYFAIHTQRGWRLNGIVWLKNDINIDLSTVRPDVSSQCLYECHVSTGIIRLYKL